VKPPPLLRDRPIAVQILLAVVLPIAFGALCGFELAHSRATFQILMLVAGIGGIGGGFEHPGPRAGAVRGVIGGVLFTTALVLVFDARGLPVLAPLPASLPITAIGYAAGGPLLGALGGWLRARSIARATARREESRPAA
jgi:hypothetical protein